jgi:hypothetical protein
MDQILEKLVLPYIKGSKMKKKKKFLSNSKFLFVPVVLRLRGKIVPPPIMAQSAKIFSQKLSF